MILKLNNYFLVTLLSLAMAFFLSCSNDSNEEQVCGQIDATYSDSIKFIIEGKAFLGVSDGKKTFYTKSENFSLDEKGCIVMSGNGLRLQGKMANSNNNFSKTIGNLQMPLNKIANATATTEVKISGNLNGKENSSIAESIEIFDESGAEHTLTITFIPTGKELEWEWETSFTRQEVISSGSGNGKIIFGQDGTISSWTFESGGSQLIVDPHNGARSMRINLNVGGPGNFKGLTIHAVDATNVSMEQNGRPMGSLSKLTLDEYGLIEGSFSNGDNRSIAQIMLVDFENPSGLVEFSDNVYTTSASSGNIEWGLPIIESSSKLKGWILMSKGIITYILW